MSDIPEWLREIVPDGELDQVCVHREEDLREYAVAGYRAGVKAAIEAVSGYQFDSDVMEALQALLEAKS